MPVSDDEDDEETESFSRLEEIKEEDEGALSIKVNDERSSSQRQQSPQLQSQPAPQQELHSHPQPQRARHEKMKLATITTTTMEEVIPPLKNKRHYDRSHHLPSPPPSVAVSRSSTVSPLTSNASLPEEDESIAEAAMILMSHNSNGVKHRYVESQEEEEDAATDRLGHAVKKIKV